MWPLDSSQAVRLRNPWNGSWEYTILSSFRLRPGGRERGTVARQTRVAYLVLASALVLVSGWAVVVVLPSATLELPEPAAPPGAPTWMARPARPAFPFEPRVGQDGKDVVWIPSAEGVVDAMLRLAEVTERDYLIDLGSGDGRTVIAAAARGARALGIEYDPALVDLSRRAADAAGVSDRATFVKADIFQSDFSSASVITMFLLPSINLQLRPTLLRLKPGTRIVSNTFTMDDWLPDGTSLATRPCEHWCLALLWVVPARVEGRWRLGSGVMTLSQRYQVVSGDWRSGPARVAVSAGRVRGDLLEFSLESRRCRGRVADGTIAGTCDSPTGTTPWTAERLRP